MKNLLVKLFLVIIFGFFSSTYQNLYSSTSGSLVGIISDEETNEYLPGVFIQLEGTQMGTQTTDDGIFFIHNIPIGTYNIQISLIGYEKKIIKDVTISADQKTRLEIKLKTEAVPGEYVVVEAPAPMVRKDITASQYSVRRKEIKAMPVTSVEQILTTKPGVVEGGHIRGGRAEETVYVVDGIVSGFAFDADRHRDRAHRGGDYSSFHAELNFRHPRSRPADFYSGSLCAYSCNNIGMLAARTQSVQG